MQHKCKVNVIEKKCFRIERINYKVLYINGMEDELLIR